MASVDYPDDETLVLIAFLYFRKYQEDAALLKLIETGGLREAAERGLPEVWIELADLLNNGRTNKQCRDRFQNHLRTGIKKGNWTKEEIKLIEDMYKSFGSK